VWAAATLARLARRLLAEAVPPGTQAASDMATGQLPSSSRF
jgi:hypothetical protein